MPNIDDFLNRKSAKETTAKILENFRKRRKELKMTQQKIAEKSKISYGSIKRFEQTGEISFQSLLKIAEVLNFLDDFYKLFDKKETNIEE